VRGLLLGLLLFPVVVITVLSLRPGGLRQQLRFAARRLRLALVLAGVYMVASAALRLAFPGSPAAEWATAGIAVVLSAVFLVAGQDPPAPAAGDRPRR
jgi:hypothetical protein